MKITENGIELKVIGAQEPIGICGSGILTVVKELLRVGLVRKEGAFIKKNKLDESDYRYKDSGTFQYKHGRCINYNEDGSVAKEEVYNKGKLQK